MSPPYQPPLFLTEHVIPSCAGLQKSCRWNPPPSPPDRPTSRDINRTAVGGQLEGRIQRGP